MRKIALLIISTLIASGTYAQTSDNDEFSRTHEFGIHAGASTGVGLSYRYWPKKVGLQLTLMPVKTEDVTFISAGVTGLYSFHESRRFRFFGYIGNSFTVNNYRKYDYSYNYNTDTYGETNEYVHSTRYNIGFGPGFGFGTRVRFNIMAGYGIYDVLGKVNIYPTGELGLYFRL